jgi:hypothetical protein
MSKIKKQIVAMTEVMTEAIPKISVAKVQFMRISGWSRTLIGLWSPITDINVTTLGAE